MIYVALLRGINVGGKSRVEMSRLKLVFASLSCQDIVSYINSGNIIFKDERQPPTLVPLIETAIEKEFGFKVRVMLRDMASINQLCDKIPAEWVNDGQQKTDVMFSGEQIDNPAILKQVTTNSATESILYSPGALIWNISRQRIKQGAGIKLVSTDYYQQMTVRNVNTVRKLQALMG